ncbi:adenosylcobinamide-GDP ribazoletransferase [Psychrobacter sp. FDAARGOS_221]|uniref:adenosylcobinamide-GDP ribazoletransferase n=1 Tax=Psychrobacter sp. FDAARGOS_221 TaxID=1975705 RepID=UPI000BB59D0E|nr:adenosylcobinamide-GDP ribazoletransferase [Psychrobacter sp. FDAARGOS_221]PNK61612.1 adenosylcobinamide-GDP ribazoletransferase [Psychrobacter sp. FDAARGOS_221]
MSSTSPHPKRSVIESIKTEWRLLLVAIQFLTRIPVTLNSYQPNWLHQSSRHFPGVGLIVGMLCAAVFALVSYFFNPLVAAIASTAFGIKLTGAFHEDGLADTCDGLGGGLTRERTLIIMKDSRIGTYGSLGLVCALLLKVSLLASMPTSVALAALIVAHSVSRWMSTSLIVALPYGGEIEHAKAKPMAQQMSSKQWFASGLWLIAVAMVLVVVLPDGLWQISLGQWLLAITFVAIAMAHMYRLLKRRLQGYTGDGLGATQQITEIAIYAGLAATINF